MARPIQAAGAVVLRGPVDEREVLVIHRPAYDDWTLPKGKPNPDEYLPVTAAREVLEETGHQIILRRQLSDAHYPVGGRPKTVHWWLAEANGAVPVGHDDEADLVEWWPVQRAITKLSYADEVAVLTEAMRVGQQLPLLIVRHAKAMNRKQWHGRDADRRLTERGRRQAKSLAELLAVFGVSELASSSSTRCMRTFAPYAQRSGLAVRGVPQLSEESATADPNGVVQAMAQLRDLAAVAKGPLAICGHRPVLPAMFDFLGRVPKTVMKPAEVVLVYPGDRSAAGQNVHIAPKL